jgi:hypothetical protein
MEVGKPAGPAVQSVDMRGLQMGIAHAGKIPHALVISQDQDDIGAAALKGLRFGESGAYTSAQ